MHVWPDPFNPAKAVNGTLKFSCLPDGSTVEIYTLSGELVCRVTPVAQLAQWDGRNLNGVLVSSGIYYYVVRQGSSALAEGKFLVLQ